MCGICGFVTKHKISYEKLKEMNNSMVHRGPDDSGEEIECVTENIWIGLAQRRLSILDLSGLGHQPMQSADGSVSVVFNGEIYNYQELKSVLSGYPFRSHCDTEVILAAYLKWGIGCVKRFNGMFAFAVSDRRTKEVWLARDRIGKKPLYYYWHHGELVFGSELKPLMAYPYFEKRSTAGCYHVFCTISIYRRRRRYLRIHTSWSQAPCSDITTDVFPHGNTGMFPGYITKIEKCR